MKVAFLILASFLFSTTLFPIRLTMTNEDTIIDNYLRGETFKQELLFKVKSRVQGYHPDAFASCALIFKLINVIYNGVWQRFLRKWQSA
jgi:hypothetical protein